MNLNLSKTNLSRALILCWFVLGAWAVIGIGGVKDWPPEAITYFKWAEYKIDTTPLPFHLQAFIGGLIFSIAGATLLFFRLAFGKFILLLGLALHFYASQSSIPTIASNGQLTLDAIFYLLTGIILGISFNND